MKAHERLLVVLACLVLSLSGFDSAYAVEQTKKPLVLSGKLDIETFTPYCALRFSRCFLFVYSMPVLVVDERIYILTPEFDASVRAQLISSAGSEVTIIGHSNEFDASSMTHVSFCRPYSCSSIANLLVFVDRFQNIQDAPDLSLAPCRWLSDRCVQ